MLSKLKEVARPGAKVRDKVVLLLGYIATRGGRPVDVPVTVAASGTNFALRLRDRSDFWVAMEIFGAEDYGFVQPPRTPVIVDVGSNIGFAALYFAGRFPNSEVHAIEPAPRTFERLVENVAGSKIHTHNLALGDQMGEIALHTYPKHLSSSILDRGIEGGKVVSVPMTTLADFARSNGIDRIGLLKVDIEGAEERLFANLGDVVIEQVVAEIHTDLISADRTWFEARLPGMSCDWWTKGDRLILHASLQLGK